MIAMKSLLLATAILSLSVGAAFAGEGNGNPFPFAASGAMVADMPLTPQQQTGTTPMMTKNPPNSVPQGKTAMASATRQYGSVSFTAGAGVLPTNGSQGAVQTADSLPPGFQNGTVAYEQAASVQRHLAQQDRAATQRAYARAPVPLPSGTRG
jgi:hypothetical protein